MRTNAFRPKLIGTAGARQIVIEAGPQFHHDGGRAKRYHENAQRRRHDARMRALSSLDHRLNRRNAVPSHHIVNFPGQLSPARNLSAGSLLFRASTRPFIALPNRASNRYVEVQWSDLGRMKRVRQYSCGGEA
jgi:hypothetical protein